MGEAVPCNRYIITQRSDAKAPDGRYVGSVLDQGGWDWKARPPVWRADWLAVTPWGDEECASMEAARQAVRRLDRGPKPVWSWEREGAS